MAKKITQAALTVSLKEFAAMAGMHPQTLRRRVAAEPDWPQPTPWSRNQGSGRPHRFLRADVIAFITGQSG